MEKITCPSCKYEFQISVEDVFKKELEEKYNQRYETKYNQRLNEELNRLKEISKQNEIRQKNEREDQRKRFEKQRQEDNARFEKQRQEQNARFEKQREEDKQQRQEELRKFEKIKNDQRQEDIERFEKQSVEQKEYFETMSKNIKLENEEKDKKIKDLFETLSKERKEAAEKSKKDAENIKKELEQKHTFELKEKDIKLESYKKQMDNLKHTSNSQERQGEIYELVLEDKLQEFFPNDKIEAIKKGQKGADVIQYIFNYKGEESGSILYESKNTAVFKEEWIKKLKEDQSRIKADLSVLVSKELPKNVEDDYYVLDGVIVLKMDFVLLKLVSNMLKERILAINVEKNKNKNYEGKANKIYEYVSSNEFKLSVGNTMKNFYDLRENIEKQEGIMIKYFSKQKKQIEMIVSDINRSIGSIEAVVSINDILEPPKDEIF